jgi:hypothetical protein
MQEQIMATSAKTKSKAYMVFSTTRDIFFGFAEKTGPRMELTQARRVYSYPKHPECGGPDAMAVYGAYVGVKAGPVTAKITVESVANSVECTPEAARVWTQKTQQW